MQFIDLQTQRARLHDELDRAIAQVLEHGQFILGPEVERFERALGEFTGAPQVVSCANGTDALVLALRALGVRDGRAVVVPTFTFAATAEAVVLAGGTPVFADVDAKTFNLSARTLQEALEARGDVVGVVAVDLFGLPAPYGALRETLGDDCFLLADAAQSIGGLDEGTAVGSLVDITTTSFFPAKPLGCYGDGGAVLTTRRDVADIVRSLRSHGKGSNKYDNERIGTNSRLDTLQAAILLCKLTVLEDEMERREAVAARYTSALRQSRIGVPELPNGVRSAWAQYTVRVPQREQLRKALKARGVPTAVYYARPLHRQTAYAQFPRANRSLPVSDELSEDVLSLPMHPYLEENAQDEVIESLLSAV